MPIRRFPGCVSGGSLNETMALIRHNLLTEDSVATGAACGGGLAISPIWPKETTRPPAGGEADYVRRYSLARLADRDPSRRNELVLPVAQTPQGDPAGSRHVIHSHDPIVALVRDINLP